MGEINLLDRLPRVKRDLSKRAEQKTLEDRAVAKRYGRDFFDGERRHGYGGYRYDGRWRTVAERMIEYYKLPKNAALLDIGCAKGFFMFDFKQALPSSTVRGLDVSEYAKANAHGEMEPLIDIGSAELLPYPDASFDLVISINSIHNLPLEACKRALSEIQRVTRGHAFVSVDAWRNEDEKRRLMDWILTAETYMSVGDWVTLFGEVGYKGDYWWFIP